MTSAKPSRALPRSNFHRSVAAGTAAAAPASSLPKPSLHLNTAVYQSSPTRESSHLEHVVYPESLDSVENLVIVCCHAIFYPDPSNPAFPLSTPYDESNWHLAPFQRSNPITGKPGEHETFLSHLAAGLDALSFGSWAGNSLLVVSGGATKVALTSTSEARSYYNAALALALAHNDGGWGRARHFFDSKRLLLEEHATDSFQNLLFGILLFRRTTGRYPLQIRIITHAFKTTRFLELHAPAIGWPIDRIRVNGIGPFMSATEYTETVGGEREYGMLPWSRDPLGTGEVLARKRKQRGWNDCLLEVIGAGLEDSVAQLLTGTIPETLPWQSAPGSDEGTIKDDTVPYKMREPI